MKNFPPPHHLDTLPYLRVGLFPGIELTAEFLARNPLERVLVRRHVVSSKRMKTFEVPACALLWWPEARDSDGIPGLVRLARIEPYFNDLYFRVAVRHDAKPLHADGERALRVNVSDPGAWATREILVPPTEVLWALDESNGDHVLGLVRLARVIRAGAYWRGVPKASEPWIKQFSLTACRFAATHLVCVDGVTLYRPVADEILVQDAPSWMWHTPA